MRLFMFLLLAALLLSAFGFLLTLVIVAVVIWLVKGLFHVVRK